MARGTFIFIATVFMVTSVDAASVRSTSTASRTGVATAQNQTVNPASSYTYNYMYPYLNNQMRTALKPLDPTSPSTSPINAIVRTEKMSEPRRVVSRPAPTSNAARAATSTGKNPATSQRRVVARPSANTNMARASVNTNTGSNQRRVVARNASRATESTPTPVNPNAVKMTTPARCLADYTDCMNRYCERPDTAYNRCYCSAKLAQIDAQYQPEIESLIQQIIVLKNGGSAIDSQEFNEYWSEKVAQYSGGNSWANIDDALDIDWSTMESRVRGQNAFITGHEYCAQHISGCFYMADNLRDAYRSSIAKDCESYESGLDRLKTVAESVIRNYQE